MRPLYNNTQSEKATYINMGSTKEIILACSLDQFLQDGYKGLSMRRIANKVGVSATAIYRHYSNKEELFHQIIKNGFNTYAHYLLPAIHEATAQERFNKTLAYALDFALDHPRYFELIFVKSDTKDELSSHNDLRKESKVSFDFYTTRINECIDEGVFKEDNAEEVSALLLASYIGFFSLYIGGLLPRTEEEIRMLYWRSVDRILAGITIDEINQK